MYRKRYFVENNAVFVRTFFCKFLSTYRTLMCYLVEFFSLREATNSSLPYISNNREEKTASPKIYGDDQSVVRLGKKKFHK